MNPAIEHCLRAPTTTLECDTVAQWWPSFRPLLTEWDATIAQAIVGGYRADRAGWAFSAGYQSALRRMVPDLGRDTAAAFCVTEDGGNRPRDILTVLEPLSDGGYRLSGTKRWATLGPDSTEMLVAATLKPAGSVPTGITAVAAPAPGESGAQPQTGPRPGIRMVRIRTATPGVRLIDMPPTRFVPEVPHARLALDDVRVDASALMPGDGYSDYVKPFRTIEDTHINAALLAYLLREARARGWPRSLVERTLAILEGLARIAPEDPSSPGTHLVLTGLLDWTHHLFAQAAPLWAAAGDDPAAMRWQRDTALFGMSGATRTLRATRAWERYGLRDEA